LSPKNELKIIVDVSFPARYVLCRRIVNKSLYISDSNEAYLYLSDGDNGGLFKSKDKHIKRRFKITMHSFVKYNTMIRSQNQLYSDFRTMILDI